MKELVYPPLIINIIFFICGLILGISPRSITVSNPRGYVYVITYSVLIFSLISIVIVAAGIIGVQVFGSGLSDTSVQMIVRCIIFFTAWSIFSTTSFVLLTSIPLLGAIIYTILTIMYSAGVFLQLADLKDGNTSKTSGVE